MRSLIVFIWEQWRQTNKALAIVFSGLVLYGLIAWQLDRLLKYAFSNSYGLMLSAAHLPVLGAVVLLFLQENRGRVGFAYPRRMLVLPAHTFSLVAAPLIYRLCVIGLFAFATGWVCDAFIADVYFKGPQILLLLTLVAALHAFVFLICGYGASTGTAIFIAAFIVGLPGLNVFIQSTILNFGLPNPKIPPIYTVPDIGFGGLPFAFLLIPYWFAVAYVGARHARSEVAEDPVGGLVRFATRITYFGEERDEFPSPEAAQQWLEWRRGAYLFPWLAFALGLILVVALPAASEAQERRFVISFFVLGVSPAVVASLVGYIVTRPGNDYQWFVGARPLLTATIARARLRAGIKALIWAYVLLGVLFLVAFKVMFWDQPIVPSLVSDLHNITSTEGTVRQGIPILAMLAVLAALTSWSLFWLARVAGVVVMFVAAGVSIWLYLKGGGLYSFGPNGVTTPMTPGITAMAATSGLLGVAAIGVALWRKYISIPLLIGAVACWAVLVFLGMKLRGTVDIGSPLVVGAWMLLPFIPLASVPLTLEWQRHR
ncbi:MAG: hypothetical protein IT367_06120 [Candidatus Hydrogenedentes bacterium]|nr:hypothetical protein [Candidatus Hydrogenedentota bacterium]